MCTHKPMHPFANPKPKADDQVLSEHFRKKDKAYFQHLEDPRTRAYLAHCPPRAIKPWRARRRVRPVFHDTEDEGAAASPPSIWFPARASGPVDGAGPSRPLRDAARGPADAWADEMDVSEGLAVGAAEISLRARPGKDAMRGLGGRYRHEVDAGDEVMLDENADVVGFRLSDGSQESEDSSDSEDEDEGDSDSDDDEEGSAYEADGSGNDSDSAFSIATSRIGRVYASSGTITHSMASSGSSTDSSVASSCLSAPSSDYDADVSDTSSGSSISAGSSGASCDSSDSRSAPWWTLFSGRPLIKKRTVSRQERSERRERAERLFAPTISVRADVLERERRPSVFGRRVVWGNGAKWEKANGHRYAERLEEFGFVRVGGGK